MQNGRQKYNDNEKIILYNEVNGVCPSCSIDLMIKKGKKLSKLFEIAHIYPLNPTAEEIKLLKVEEKLSIDPNDLLNLICLCPTCHTKFDKIKSVDEYRELVQIKKRVINKNKEKELWSDYKIESEILDILETIYNLDSEFDDSVELSYEPKTIESKSNTSLTIPTKRKIINNVEDYFVVIKQKFNELDSIKLTSTEVISSQIKVYYLKLQGIYDNQNEIFYALVEWLDKKTKQKSKDACEVIVSYFIQNCEVF